MGDISKKYTTDGSVIYEDGKRLSMDEVVIMLNKYNRMCWEQSVNSGW